MLAQLESLAALPIISAMVRLLVLLLVLLFFRRGLDWGVVQIERRLSGQTIDADRRRRLDTLLRAAAGAALVVVLAIGSITALDLFGLNIAPLLASAGVVGLAISLGATTIIQDYIGGVIILAEDQFRVGDVVEIGGAAGEVVRMSLRATYLRDAAGKLYTIPNGSVRVISNLTRDWARAFVDVTLAYDTDFAQLDAALKTVIGQLKDDPNVSGLLLSDPETITWNSLTDWGVQVRVMAKTLPGKQWLVTRALRRYVIEAVQAHGLQIAFPITNVRTGPTELTRQKEGA
jgi:small conductance mechanosensitive channel